MRRLRPPVLLFLFAVLPTLPPLAAATPPAALRPVVPVPGVPAPGARPAVCLPGDEPEAVTLSGVWTEAMAHEPGYRAAAERQTAEGELRAAARREWAPTAALQGLGNQGMRLSPREERLLGVGPRGEFRLLGSWGLLDSDRTGRSVVARHREREMEAASRTFEAGHLAAVATLYVEGAVAEGLWDVRSAHLERLMQLAGPVRERLAEGLDVRWEGHLLEEAVARAERLLVEAEQERIGARAELSRVAGRCARAGSLLPEVGTSGEAALGESPAVVQLLHHAETREAMARAEEGRGRWRLELVGVIGPNHSRAFEEGRVQSEYLFGVAGSWQPDLAGVRGRMAEAEASLSRAARAEAESLRLLLGRELDRIQAALDHAEVRRRGLTLEREAAERREEVAVLRWREGADRWTEVMQAVERVLEARTLEIQLRREVALALVRQGELTGQLGELPARLGAEGAR